MINIVTWLGNDGHNEELAAFCAGADIRIEEDSFKDIEDFLEKFNDINSNIDAVVLNDTMLGEENKRRLFENIRSIEPNVRIIVIFPGYRNQYVEDQIKEYKEVYGVSDIIFEGRSLDLDSFVEVIKKGFVYDYSLNVLDDQEISGGKKKKPCVTVGVMGTTRGCGVTNMTVSVAEYIALSEKIPVRVVDFTESGNLRFARHESNITYIVGKNIDMQKLRSSSEALVFDFGTPYNISPKGRLLSTSACFSDEKMKIMRGCDLKIIMNFSDPWHRGKLKFLLRDRIWKRSLENGCLFLFDSVNDEMSAGYRNIRINGRNDKLISSAVRELFAGGKGLN